jgi:hypothetical protein
MLKATRVEPLQDSTLKGGRLLALHRSRAVAGSDKHPSLAYCSIIAAVERFVLHVLGQMF